MSLSLVAADAVNLTKKGREKKEKEILARKLRKLAELETKIRRACDEGDDFLKIDYKDQVSSPSDEYSTELVDWMRPLLEKNGFRTALNRSVFPNTYHTLTVYWSMSR